MPNGTYGGVRGKETKIGRKKKTSFPYLLDCRYIDYRDIEIENNSSANGELVNVSYPPLIPRLMGY